MTVQKQHLVFKPFKPAYSDMSSLLLKYFLQHEIFVPNLGEHLSRSKVIQE